MTTEPCQMPTRELADIVRPSGFPVNTKTSSHVPSSIFTAWTWRRNTIEEVLGSLALFENKMWETTLCKDSLKFDILTKQKKKHLYGFIWTLQKKTSAMFKVVSAGIK